MYDSGNIGVVFQYTRIQMLDEKTSLWLQSPPFCSIYPSCSAIETHGGG